MADVAQLCVCAGYGLTETSPVISATPLASCASKPASAGVLVANTELKVGRLSYVS